MNGRGGMWILNSFVRDRDLLCPKRESSCVWPHTTPDNRVFFMNDSFDAMRREICSGVEAMQIDSLPLDKVSHIRVTPSSGLHSNDIAFSIKVCRHPKLIVELISRNSTLFDVDARLDEKNKDCSVWASLAFCSYRFDDVQHYVVGLDKGKIAWEACTIEEEYITTNVMSESTIQLRIHRNVFLFDKDRSMLSLEQLDPITRTFGRIFDFLPYDVVRLIAEMVHAQTNVVSLQRFNKGSSVGVFNYATARLLRIAWMFGKETSLTQFKQADVTVPSLLEFHHMKLEQRKLMYPTMKRTLRQRHQVFNREVCRKRTRSGLGY